MMKRITYFLLIFIISFSSEVAVRAMEANQNQESPKKLSKSQIKRLKRNQAKKRQNERDDIFNSEKLDYFVKNGDLKATLNFNDDSIYGKQDYLKKLNFFANVLLMQQWAIDICNQYSENAAMILRLIAIEGETSCISIQDDGVGICGHKKDELGEETTKIIKTPAVKELVLEITAPMILAGKPCSAEDYKKCFYILEDAENQEPDMLIFARYTRTLAEHLLLMRNLTLFVARFLSLFPKLIKKFCDIVDLELEIEQKDVHLDSKSMFTMLSMSSNLEKAQNEIIPYFFSLEAKISDLLQLINDASKEIKLESINDLFNGLKNITKSWNGLKEANENLYRKILYEAAEILSTIPSYSPHRITTVALANETFLYPPLNSKKLPQCFTNKELVTQPAVKQTNSFIDGATKPQSSPKVKKSKKKKSRKRGHRKTQVSQDEEEAKDIPTIKESASAPSKQERIKFPCYADRIIARFNRPQNIEDLYHTFSPLADAFIIKYGTVEQRPNQTFPDQIDTKYSIKGKVEYKDGEVIYGTFGVTLGAIDKICYHREFMSPTREQDNLDFADIKFDEEFPTLISKDNHFTAARLQFNAQNDEIYGEKRFSESQECIIIKDARNKAMITLFKTENNNTI